MKLLLVVLSVLSMNLFAQESYLANEKNIQLGKIKFKDGKYSFIVKVDKNSAQKVDFKFSFDHTSRVCANHAMTIRNGQIGSLGCLWYNYHTSEKKREVKMGFKKSTALTDGEEFSVLVTIKKPERFSKKLTYSFEQLSGPFNKLSYSDGIIPAILGIRYNFVAPKDKLAINDSERAREVATADSSGRAPAVIENFDR